MIFITRAINPDYTLSLRWQVFSNDSTKCITYYTN